MKIIKSITKTITVDEIDDVICNKCGDSCRQEHRLSNEGLIEISVQGGYWSNYIGDGTRYTFSICEKCLIELFASFKIEPEKEEMF